MKADCPICGSTDLAPVMPSYQGPLICSNMSIIQQGAIAPVCCRGCGMIFETLGIREKGSAFYQEGFQPKATVQYFDGPKQDDRPHRAFQLLEDMVGVGEQGRLLDLGAGKGDFLAHFQAQRPGWKLSAVEPGDGWRTIEKNLSMVALHPSGYESGPMEEGSQDLVVALGVIEHVNDPVDFLTWAGRRLADGGHFFLEAPNFEQLPGDLFCPDHLSKFTIASLKLAARKAGLHIKESRDLGVPLFLCLVKGAELGNELPNCFQENMDIARRNNQTCQAQMGHIKQGFHEAKDRSENFGIFGLTTLGIFAPYYLQLDPEGITAFVDENPRYHESRVHGCEVGGLDLIEKLDIRHVAIAVSPVYQRIVAQKLQRLDVAVYGSDNY